MRAQRRVLAARPSRRMAHHLERRQSHFQQLNRSESETLQEIKHSCSSSVSTIHSCLSQRRPQLASRRNVLLVKHKIPPLPRRDQHELAPMFPPQLPTLSQRLLHIRTPLPPPLPALSLSPNGFARILRFSRRFRIPDGCRWLPHTKNLPHRPQRSVTTLRIQETLLTVTSTG